MDICRLCSSTHLCLFSPESFTLPISSHFLVSLSHRIFLSSVYDIISNLLDNKFSFWEYQNFNRKHLKKKKKSSRFKGISLQGSKESFSKCRISGPGSLNPDKPHITGVVRILPLEKRLTLPRESVISHTTWREAVHSPNISTSYSKGYYSLFMPKIV